MAAGSAARVLAFAVPLLMQAAGCATSDRLPVACRRGECLQLDHIFVFVTKGAPEREALVKSGLRTDGEVTRHVGQGTASIGFVFDNAYLELLWVEDEAEFTATCAIGDAFCERPRWRQTGASPFGLGLRNTCGVSHPPPLKHREDRAPWMKADSCIYTIDAEAGMNEPDYFVVPPYMALPAWVDKVDTTHPLAVHRLTRCVVTVPPDARGVSDFGIGSGFNFASAARGAPYSPAVRLVARSKEVRFIRGPAPLLALTFDDARQGKSADLRPDLPILMQY